jgi:hypothetical protein
MSIVLEERLLYLIFRNNRIKGFKENFIMSINLKDI